MFDLFRQRLTLACAAGSLTPADLSTLSECLGTANMPTRLVLTAQRTMFASYGSATSAVPSLSTPLSSLLSIQCGQALSCHTADHTGLRTHYSCLEELSDTLHWMCSCLSAGGHLCTPGPGGRLLLP